MIQKGEIYWYKSQKETYGFIVLEYQKAIGGSSDYLIAISDAMYFIGKEPKPKDVLNTRLFTIAWFSIDSILPERRIRFITRLSLVDSFKNMAGLSEDEKGSYSLNNIGNSAMWRHEYRRMVLPDAFMKDVLSVQNIPRTIDNNYVWRVSSDSRNEQKKEECKSGKEEKRFAEHTNPFFSYRIGDSIFLSPEATSKKIWIDIDAEVTRDEKAMEYIVRMINNMETVLHKAKDFLKKVLMDKDDENYEIVYGFLDFHQSYVNSYELNHFFNEQISTVSLINMIDYLKVKRLASYKVNHIEQPFVDLDLCFASDNTNEVLTLSFMAEGKIISVRHES
jgi:hypothetical protein